MVCGYGVGCVCVRLLFVDWLGRLLLGVVGSWLVLQMQTGSRLQDFLARCLKAQRCQGRGQTKQQRFLVDNGFQ